MWELAQKPWKLGLKGLLLFFHFIDWLSFFLSIPVQIKPWHNWQRFSKTKRKAKTDTVITASLRPISSHSMSASSWFPPKALSLMGQQAWGSCWLKASRAGCSVSPWDSERKRMVNVPDREGRWQTDWNMLHCFYMKLPAFHWFKC